MCGRRESRPGIEPLESRELLVGFYEGPALSPKHLALLGSIAGTAVVKPATAAHAGTIKIVAIGRVSPVGRATVSGTLRVVDGQEGGTLVLHSSTSSLTFEVQGVAPADEDPTSAMLPFAYSGVGYGPTTINGSQIEEGLGSLTVAIGPGSGRVSLTLTFGPSSSGPRAPLAG